ncbi:MAG TPA: aminoacyl-tRNA hydrolase, partial [Methanocorpusculum sp.]|nr:aminoacyl-tRNA hydrolase [Methanocorpusculum sp.]
WNHKTDTFDKVCEKSEIFESIAYQNGWTDEEMQKRIDDRINLLTELSKREHVATKEMEDEIISLGLEEQKYV